MKTETAIDTRASETVSRLELLGLTVAASVVKEKALLQRKLMLAYEHYRFVRQEHVDNFNADLRNKGTRSHYQTLDFTPLERYAKVPPETVLTSLETAIGRRCFDAFEVAYIRDVKDPILFGRVNGCSDRFFIDEWDNDVSISDLLKPNEG